ncbi:MAG: FtsL-like putative cell division protein [Chitinophagales bacterium]|nr:FtsL-like putative cell division protein [Chitinophagales bacterium]
MPKDFIEEADQLQAHEPEQVDGEKVSLAGVAKRMKSALNPENLFANLPFVLFLAALAVVYIYNTHSMETTLRDIDKTKQELKEYRWRYMSGKSKLMFNSKQTEIATSVQPLGLKELTTPPKKIEVKEGEY